MEDVVMLADGSLESGRLYTPQRMAAALSRSRRVVFVEPPYAARNLLRHPWETLLRSVRPERENLFVVSPPVPLPDRSRHARPLRAAAQRIERAFLGRALRRLGVARFLVWSYSPYDAPLLERFEGAPVVFEYKDEIASFPAYRSPRRARALARLEARALRRADVVFVPTEVLARRKRALHARVHVVPFGVDGDRFVAARIGSADVPRDVAGLPRPLVGYVGALDRYKVDFGLLRSLAADLPGCTFVLIGPAGVTDGTPAADVPSGPNVVWLGERPHESVPAYLGAFDVCIVPHRPDGYGATNFPFKVLEYLAAGKPVVATDMPALRELGGSVLRAGTPAEFARLLEETLHAPRREAVAAPPCVSWEERADRMIEILGEAGRLGRGGEAPR